MLARRLPVLIAALSLVACADAVPLAPYPVVPVPAELPLRDGTACVETAMPAWQIDATTRTAKLADDSVSVAIPKHLLATQERPELLVLSGPRNGAGPQARYELLVTPRCETVNARSTLQRMAARTVSHRYKAAEVGDQFTQQKSFKKPFDGNTEQVAHGELLMRDAELSLTLVYKPVAQLTSYDVVLNAGCPRYEEPGRRCLRDHQLLAKSVTVVAPPAPPAAPTPAPEAPY